MPFQQGTVAIYPINGQLHPLATGHLISVHRLQFDFSALIGFTSPDTGIAKVVTGRSIIMVYPIKIWDGLRVSAPMIK